MKLLIVTQVVDTEDLGLGFFHTWILKLAQRFESIEVICLKEGKHTLPSNVHIHSLGKEQGPVHSFRYALRFLKLAWQLRTKYDAVFVHMNQEYILISGLFWRLFGKSVYLWRNHYDGSFLTDIAAFFSTKVFCTSQHSYTAKYRKTTLMPVGVDTERFSKSVSRQKNSILFFSRISPSKRPEMFIDALGLLKERGVTFSASVVGSSLPKDEAYHRMLKAKAEMLGLKSVISFSPGVPNDKAPGIFGSHEIFINTSPSGMFDKMLFEAAASGCLVVTTSEDFKEIAGEQFWCKDVHSLAERLEFFLGREKDTSLLENLVRTHSLTHLIDELGKAIIPPS